MDSIEWFVPAQKQTLRVPRWVCSRTTEIFFEGDRKGIHPDIDEIGLPNSIISCLLRLPNDVRASVMQAVVTVGGGAAIPGLRTRLQNSVESIWEEKYGRVGSVRSTMSDETPYTSPSRQHNQGTPLPVADSASVKKRPSFKFIATNPLEAVFIGASLLGDVKARGSVEVSREAFNSSHGRGVTDWTFLGGLKEDGIEENNRKSRS